VTCRLPSDDERETLRTDGEPVLVIWRRCYNQHRKIMEANKRIVVSGRQEVICRYGR
jgi:hypothetical protein